MHGHETAVSDLRVTLLYIRCHPVIAAHSKSQVKFDSVLRDENAPVLVSILIPPCPAV